MQFCSEWSTVTFEDKLRILVIFSIGYLIVVHFNSHVHMALSHFDLTKLMRANMLQDQWIVYVLWFIVIVCNYDLYTHHFRYFVY